MQANDLSEVNIKVPFKDPYRSQECETWITLIEQFLACNYEGYFVTIGHDNYKQVTDITIKFANIEDATFFKLQKYR